MSPRVQRTISRVGALLVVLAAAVIIVWLTSDAQVRTIAIGLAAAAALGLEKWINESSSETASPTVEAVNLMQQTQAPSVAPPSVAVPKPVLTMTDPNVPPPGV